MSKGFSAIIMLVIIVLMAITAGGAYYLGTTKTQPKISMSQPVQSTPTSSQQPKPSTPPQISNLNSTDIDIVTREVAKDFIPSDQHLDIGGMYQYSYNRYGLRLTQSQYNKFMDLISAPTIRKIDSTER